MLDDLKDMLGEKGFWAVIIGAGVLFVVMLLKDSNSETEEILVTPTAYSSYPDAVTNANVIIDSVNQSTEGYIETGLSKLQESLGSSFNEIDESIDGLTGSVNDIRNDVSGVKDTVSGIAGDVSTIKKNTANSTPTIIYRTSTVKDEDKSDGFYHSTDHPGKYYGKTSYAGNSIVDGFKALGVYEIDGVKVDDVASRVAVAEKNGIKNYTGTAAQNTELLKKLQQGRLLM